MTVQKRQLVARLMDDLSNQDNVSDQDVEQLINDSETRSIWSRFHLVSDIIKGDAPEAITLDFDQRVQSAISNEPTLLVPSARNKKSNVKTQKAPSFVVANIRDWAQQATGLAIAASVTAVMVLGVQALNSPQTTQMPHSAITSLELLEVDNLQIAEESDYSQLQENILDYTRTSSQYGLQFLKPQVSVVSHSVTVPLTLIKSNFDSLLEESKKIESEQPKETEQ
ncbi:MAG: negative regulator of sigma E activity [Enterobacterales bacterium]|jgi:negative regulator of sigma E activity